jgi:hypothetical protein
MKYAIAIAAFSAIAAAQSTTSAAKSGGNTDIPYPTFSIATPSITDAAQATKIIENFVSDASNYLTSVTAQPEFSAFTSVIGSIVPESELPDNFLDTAAANSLATATPTWWTKLPTSAQAYYTSIIADQLSIVSKDFKGPAAPTAAPMMKAAGVAAAGALAGAAMLL